MDIRKESYKLKTFVANRIATIQEMTSSEQWRYVATEQSCRLRFQTMDSLKLKTCELWWNGPKFLMSNKYPQRQIPVAVIKDPEHKESKRIGPLDLELKKAEQLLLKLVQKEEFKVEMNGIQNSAMVPSNSRVKTLNLFIDSEGILRVGGRLRNSDINYN
ncbi:integrase catalytic domain-containing protein [Trichonephila clavipes]|nr:integrase catalytic domain-containing protein [Trichonephila clavipes]